MRMHIFAAFFQSIVASGCTDGAVDLSPADYGAIDELRDSVTNAIVAGDAAAYAELCTEDVRLLHAGSPIISGRAELETHNAAMFEAVVVTSPELTPVEIYGTGDEATVASVDL